MAFPVSNFVKDKILLLLDRYTLSYYKEGNCIEYFITDKDTKEEISYVIVFSLNNYSKQINVGRFCPNLYKQVDSRYLSAACFYLLIHHFAHIYHLPREYRICLQTRPVTNKIFFTRLKDFDFYIRRPKLCQSVELCGTYPDLAIDTSVINERIMEDETTLFQV